MSLTRRRFAMAIMAGAAYGVTGFHARLASAMPASVSAARVDQAQEAIAAVAAKSGGRLGVVALDTGSGGRIALRPTERFAMCSTHKLISAAAILSLVDRGYLKLDQRIPFSQAEVLEYAPIARKSVAAGFMTLEDVCMAAATWSDNTAANLLLGLMGGPAGWTRYIRSLGDETTRLDRSEPDMNSALTGDERDTTTPEAMVQNVIRLLCGKALSDASRERLKGWLLDSPITGTLLRAKLPSDWHVGDKSGSGDNGTRNDIGIMLPPHAAPIAVAVYHTESPLKGASRDLVVAEIGKIIMQAFSPV
ncbi:MAG: class A beta-lactamase [Magnetococcales bacterium]|nr:class A beta-lactamase [Magnetococcales bacterium]